MTKQTINNGESGASVRSKLNSNFTELYARVVNVAEYATGGDGSSGSPWTGWDTAITWAEQTAYRFRSGYYAHDGATNFLKREIALIGETGVIIKHTGSGPAMKFDAGTSWIFGARIENIIVEGNYSTGTGTASPVSGQTSLTGSGTNWLSSVAVGDSITFWSDDFLDVETRVVTNVASNTSLTVDAAWDTSRTNQQFRIGKTTHGFFLNGLRSASVVNCSAKGVSGAAFYVQAGVCNYFGNLRTYYYSPPLGIFVRNAYGLWLTDGNRPGNTSTANVFDNMVMEHTRTAGIRLDALCDGNAFDGGTSEGNIGRPVICDGAMNTFTDLWCEVNTIDEWLVDGDRNVFTSCKSTDVFKITGSKNVIVNCSFNVNVSGVSAESNMIIGLDGTLTDTGTATKYMGVGLASKQDTKLGICRGIGAAFGAASGSVSVDASQANVWRQDMSGDFTIANPTNLTDGQELTWQFTNNTGSSIAVSYGSMFRAAGPASSALPSTITASGVLLLQGKYWAAANKIDIYTAPALLLNGGTLTGALAGTTANFTTSARSAKGYFGNANAGDFANPNLDNRDSDSTAVSTGLQTNKPTVLIGNEDTTAGSFCQLVMFNGASGVGYFRFVSIRRGSADADLQLVSNAGVIANLDSSASTLTLGVDLIQKPAASITPVNNGELVAEATSNTSLTFKLKGSDGVVRSGSITLS